MFSRSRGHDIYNVTSNLAQTIYKYFFNSLDEFVGQETS